jgi:transposase
VGSSSRSRAWIQRRRALPWHRGQWRFLHELYEMVVVCPQPVQRSRCSPSAAVRAREAAKQDQLRACHRLSKFLLRTGQRPTPGMKAWTAPYMAWVRQVPFTQVAREATMLDYLHEVDHMGERVKRLEQANTEAVKLAAPAVREVVKGLQALRGIAEISAVTIVAELGNITRFETPRQLMGYSGAVPSEDSSGKRTRRGRITKTGNAHLRRIVVEAA